mgnify:CR=1 FL=1
MECDKCEEGYNLMRGYECLHCGNVKSKYQKKIMEILRGNK